MAADAPTVPGVDGDGAAESAARSAGALFDNTASYVFWAYGCMRGDLERGRQLEQTR